MRRWGIFITAFYALVLLVLLLPAMTVVSDPDTAWKRAFDDLYDSGADVWVWAALLVAGQALLLLRVDRSWKKLRPRTHVAVTATLMGGAAALLVLATVVSLFAAIGGDRGVLASTYDLLLSNFTITVLASWGVWTIVFAIYYRRAPHRMANLIQWLLAGSILELLIAVPAHVIVRRRHDCSAPGATAFGIITGTAVMLLCFGPSVIALFQRRRQRYRDASTAQRALVGDWK